MLTIKEFSPVNRDKKIGNSLYRICQSDKSGKWYIHETYNYNNGSTWASSNAYYDDDLQVVIDKFNSITKEKEIVSLRFDEVKK